MANSYGTTTALSGSLTSLTNQSFSSSLGTIDFGAAPPHECFLQITAVALSGTPTGNKQAVLYVTGSIDGTNFGDAPSANTTGNAKFVGTISLPVNAVTNSNPFPLSPLFGGALPTKVSVYVFNDCGTALTGGSVYYRTETFG